MANIIIDLKKKKFKYGWDEQWSDATGVEQARKEKARTIDIPNESKNPAHNIMRGYGAVGLLNRVAYCLNDKKEMVSGRIVDVIPPKYIHLKDKGVFAIDDVVSIGG